MVKYRLVGSALSNDEGIASVVYTGVGRGLVDLVASTSSEISEGSVVSNNVEITDCIWYDDGVTNPKTKTWYNQSSAFTLTPSANGTLVETSSSSSNKLFADGTTWSNSVKWTASLCAEVKIVSSSGDNLQFMLVGNISPSIAINGEAHLKMVWDGSKVTQYVNGVQTGVTNNVTDEKLAIGFNASNGSFTFKDFVIYPI